MPCTMNEKNSKSQNSKIYNGWLIIDKPLNISSAKVVSKVKYLLGRDNKIGHAGTLDPLATGVLPLAIGEATKVVQFLLDTDKEYEFEVTWGEERSTDDAEGEVINSSDKRPTEAEIRQAMEKFKGDISQVPPIFSAIKVDGHRSYDLARKDMEVELKPRQVTVKELIFTPVSIDKSHFKMRCSKGTYVRSIARDMGRELSCYGYVSRLHRSCHGQFGQNSAISLEKLEELCQKDAVSSCILPLEEVLDGIPAFPLDEFEEAKIRNGIAITNRINISGEVIALKNSAKLVAIAEIRDGRLQPKRVFNH